MINREQLRTLYGIGSHPLEIATAMAWPLESVIRELLADALEQADPVGACGAVLQSLDRSIAVTAPMLARVS